MSQEQAANHGAGQETGVYAHVISDATGTAAERMARAALVQFHQSIHPIFIRHSFIKHIKQLQRILDTAQKQNGVVIYTMTDRRLRQWLAGENERRDLVMIDMLGPLFTLVGLRYRMSPLLDSGLLSRALGEESLKLAENIDFTLKHDDGRQINSIGRADVILLGVSRTSKTPTSIYLSSHHNLKVANVPLAPGLAPPPKLFQLKRPKMVGLTIAADKLAQVRRSRFKNAVPGYAEPRAIRDELAMAESVFERIKGIKVIDVTNRPIEEVSNLIL